MRFNHLILCFLVFFTRPLMADELLFSVTAETQNFYLSPPNSATQFSRLQLDTKGEFSLLSSFKFKLDTSTDSVFMNKQDQHPVLFTPKQFGLFDSEKYFDFFLGGFVVHPDGADLNNLFDVVHGVDYRNPFNSKPVGSWGVNLNSTIESFHAELFYIPKNTRSLLPDTQSPWWPRTNSLPITNSSGTFLISDKMSYVYDQISEYEKPFDNNWGLNSKYSFNNFDLHFFYFNGANQTPKISPHFNIDVVSADPLVGVIQPPTEINLTWYKSEHAGAGTTVVLFDWIAKVFCKQQTDFLPVNEKSTACTFSVENSVNISDLTLRYFLQSNRVWKKNPSSELETLQGFYEKSAALGVYLDLATAGLISGAVIYNEKSPSTLTSLGYEYKFTDQLRSKINANVITTSSAEALAAAYDRADNLSLQMTYDF